MLEESHIAAYAEEKALHVLSLLQGAASAARQKGKWHVKVKHVSSCQLSMGALVWSKWLVTTRICPNFLMATVPKVPCAHKAFQGIYICGKLHAPTPAVRDPAHAFSERSTACPNRAQGSQENFCAKIPVDEPSPRRLREISHRSKRYYGVTQRWPRATSWMLRNVSCQNNQLVTGKG